MDQLFAQLKTLGIEFLATGWIAAKKLLEFLQEMEPYLTLCLLLTGEKPIQKKPH